MVVSAHESEALPQDFGRYRITRRIATGGMAEIFLAHRHDAPLEPLVLKRLLPRWLERAELAAMFEAEARIARSLDHPNIVRIEDAGEIEGRPFIAMEYVHGEDIRSIYNRAYRMQSSLPLSHSTRVIADAARGLAHAHRAVDEDGRPLDLVHGDVSPQNILVTFDGHVKVIDFGVAHAATAAPSAGSRRPGKSSYLSPEQARGEAVDHRSDLFALGIVLYEITTGTRLFKRSTEVATLEAIVEGRFTPPSEALPGYPAPLERILVRTLEADPERRYQDGAVLADDLEGFLETSRSFAGRAAIAAFMTDLFADKLAEEEGSGEPALPDSADAPDRVVPQARVATQIATRRRKSVEREPGFAERPPPAASEEQGAPPPVAVRAHRNLEAGDLRPGPRPSADPEATAPPEDDPQEDPEDQRATVVAVSAYRPGPESTGADPAPAPLEPAEAAPAPATEPNARIPRGTASGRRGILVGAAVVTTAVVLGAFGVAMSRRATTEVGLIAPTTSWVTVITEPGAEVFVDGAPTAAVADDDGRAGPIELTEGSRSVRVAHAGLGFERTRTLEIEAGRTYESEIRARQGFLQLRVAPWARVKIDGQARGLTPLPPIPLLEGVHRVELHNPDLDAGKTLNVRVVAAKTQTIRVVLGPVGEAPSR